MSPLNVSVLYVSENRTGKKDQFYVENIYTEKREGELSEYRGTAGRKIKDCSGQEANLMSPPQGEPLTFLENNKISCPTTSQTPALTSTIYHHLSHSQHVGWLLMEGNPHSTAQTWAHWLMRSRGEPSPSASHAANCGELSKHPHWDHTAPLWWHLRYSSAVHWDLLQLWFVWCSPYAERNYEGREKKRRNMPFNFLITFLKMHHASALISLSA